MTAVSARQEWAAMWPVPLVAMLGACGSTMFAYSSGIFMADMTTAFGWSRAEFSFAFVLQMLAAFFIVPLLGWVTDRVGPRRVALTGIIPFAVAFSLLGLVSGPIWAWWLVCLLVAVTQAPIGPTIWVTGVVGRFQTSRGLAMAVTLAGLGLGALIWPLLSAFYIGAFGWRFAFPALAISWAVVVFPLAAAFFFGPPLPAAGTRKPRPRSYSAALKSRTFIGLMVAGGLFASGYYGILVHLVPILRTKGLSLTMAAGIGGLLGVAAIIGRLATGYLLDRLPTRPVAVGAFLLPALASALLLHDSGSVTLCAASVVLFGLSSGAEMDVITFIAARRFGQEVFASVYAMFTAIISICASAGPIVAGLVFDRTQSYDLYLMILPVMVIVGAGVVAWIPIVPAEEFSDAVPAVA